MPEQDLRYPIGPFTAPSSMSAAEMEAAIDAIEMTPAELRKAVSGLTEAQLDSPYRQGGWSVRQLVHHMPDSHLNAYIRMKLTVTEVEPTINVYDQDVWARLPDTTGDIETSLKLLEALHERWVTFLRALPAQAWTRELNHPEMGRIRLQTLLALYGWHGAHHVAHVTALRKREGW